MKKESRFVSSHRPGRALCLPFTLPASHSGLCKGKNTLAKTLRGSHEECENFTRNGRKKGKENERMEENTKYEGDTKKVLTGQPGRCPVQNSRGILFFLSWNEDKRKTKRKVNSEIYMKKSDRRLTKKWSHIYLSSPFVKMSKTSYFHINDLILTSATHCGVFSVVITHSHSWSLVVTVITRCHSWSLLVTHGHIDLWVIKHLLITH